MKEIKLTRGYVALVDDADYYRVSNMKWHVHIFRGVPGGALTSYFNRKEISEDKRKKSISMHRFLLGVTDPNVFVDHIDLNPLNNQRKNLRLCSHAENNRNRSHQIGGTSKYRGVHIQKGGKRWKAAIWSNGKILYLGSYLLEMDAAKAYNEAALKYHGEFANLNIITPKQEK